jgi:hypothetical protein
MLDAHVRFTRGGLRHGFLSSLLAWSGCLLKTKLGLGICCSIRWTSRAASALASRAPSARETLTSWAVREVPPPRGKSIASGLSKDCAGSAGCALSSCSRIFLGTGRAPFSRDLFPILEAQEKIGFGRSQAPCLRVDLHHG